MEPKFKLITSNDLDIFQDRLNAFIGSLGNDDIIVDVKFSTTGASGGVEFSALVHYQETEAWGE